MADTYTITNSDAFGISCTESSPAPGIRLLHLTADAKEHADTLEIRVSWQMPSIGVHALWGPLNYHGKAIMPNWGGYFNSCAMSGAPVMSALDYDDNNRLTIACSDAKNAVRMHTGLVEENGCLDAVVIIHIGCAVSHYEADIRIDTRDVKFYRAVADVAEWWETYDGYTPAYVPDDAKMPLYSAWYSYHQQVDVPAIVEECACFAEAGCRVLIVDDGWQTDDNARGYNYCGDWKPTTAKVPDMRAFVDAVHRTGMKFMLWYSVPFVGEYTEAYRQFSDKMLYCASDKTHVLDPRFPEVRDYLIRLYRNAVLDWGLDGFKLDFVDSFRQSAEVRPGMDYVSVYDAVDRLLKDVIAALRALNPDILLEFRQSYMGPLMRTFGNMFRVGDCPCDSYSNRMGSLSLRMTSGSSAVHSDMVMWHYDETPEQAAFQLTNVLFAVPQISVKWQLLNEGQREMIRAYTDLWIAYRDTLLGGEMLYKSYANNFPYVSARSEKTQIGAVYAGQNAYIEVPTDEIVIVNASLDSRVCVQCGEEAEYSYRISDCRGRETGTGVIALGGALAIPVIPQVPVNGVIRLTRTR